MTLADENETPGVNLGTCCACGGTDRVVNLVMLDRPAAIPGHGWGCRVCDLALDGAVAVTCEACGPDLTKLRFACCGWPAVDGRESIVETMARGVFAHDFEKHEDEEGPEAML